jgi:hypothetical protein
MLVVTAGLAFAVMKRISLVQIALFLLREHVKKKKKLNTKSNLNEIQKSRPNT